MHTFECLDCGHFTFVLGDLPAVIPPCEACFGTCMYADSTGDPSDLSDRDEHGEWYDGESDDDDCGVLV